MQINNYIEFLRLARNRSRSVEDYIAFQAFQAKLILKYLQDFNVDIKNKVVLDLGSGLGGYTQELAKQDQVKVISLDLVSSHRYIEENVYSVMANALSIPLRDGSIDFIFCASLIEHVNDPFLLLTEVKRVLRVGGYCYLSFPPFFSIHGGHEFSPFHYLGEKRALQIFGLLRRKTPDWVVKIYKPISNPETFSKTYERWGLFKLTIHEVRQIIAKVGLHIVDLSTRYVPVNTARWTFWGEFLTWHVQFLLRKQFE